ncbi:hypothetical protein [Alkalimarinus sediminis]|uniref:Uncharacterized protein n=1 Tax=Alkalimarinus sediminis TaxID=1632866 RepID=A0A9E8HI39_9ALTE|nr:hypothetical protein [Alkalimarinus sediminis]UZW75088.1 hypothetical protein NNL22_00335 [Alkalimarinus sediminis]
MSTYDLKDTKTEKYFVNTMYGTYADILFILFPFVVIALQRVWNEEGIEILKQPDLSIAAAILAGMGVGKFVLGLIGKQDLGRYKERIVFFIAVTLFFVLGPSLILIIKIVNDSDVPKFVIFAQPILLILAVALYSTAVSIGNIMTLSGAEEDDENKERDVYDGDSPTPLNIQLKTEQEHEKAPK